MPAIEFNSVSVIRDGKNIVDDFSFNIEDGEYISIVGETGAGKTTILNLISGLVKPDRGTILIGGRDVKTIPCEKRDAGMVFEHYALFPHYDVFKNVSYSHRVRDKDAESTRKATREVLNFLLLSGRDKALPAELSGGMQQRVALARALMTNSGILLLDDPFSALDAGLRMSLRIEIRNLARELGTTVIHCTNDVEEAMMVCDRMVLMREGRIEQHGKPDHLYYMPYNLYVAAFFGDINVVECFVESTDERYVFLSNPATEKEKDFYASSVLGHSLQTETKVYACIRSEHLKMRKGYRKKPNRIYGRIEYISFLGCLIRYEVVDAKGFTYKIQRFVNEKTKHMNFNCGEEVTLYFNPRLCLLYNSGSENDIGKTLISDNRDHEQ